MNIEFKFKNLDTSLDINDNTPAMSQMNIDTSVDNIDNAPATLQGIPIRSRTPIDIEKKIWLASYFVYPPWGEIGGKSAKTLSVLDTVWDIGRAEAPVAVYAGTLPQ